MSPKKVYDDKELYKFLTSECNKAKSKHPGIFGALPDTVTEKWVGALLSRVGMDPKTWYYSINSFGGGNHYCEYDTNEEQGLYGIAVHCGSRNFGVKVCKYWENKSKGGALSKAEVKALTQEFKEKYINEHGRKNMEGFKPALDNYLKSKSEGHIEGFLTGDNMKGYFCDMLIAMALR